MNRKIMPYVNYLLDNNPSPFCDYIICKELLKEDEKTIRDAYEWAKEFNLYTELRDEQIYDGSWVGFHHSISNAEAKDKKYKVSRRWIIKRLHDLSLDINDEMVAKTVDFCRKAITGEILPNWQQKSYPVKELRSVIYSFVPDDELAAPIKEEKTISEDKQRSYLIYEWDHGPWDICKMSDLISPDNGIFVTWLRGLEDLKDYSLFGEFMADSVAPYLYSLCERLSDPNDNISIKVNRYYGKVGQYSESWNNNELKKKDLLLRIIRILNKCDYK